MFLKIAFCMALVGQLSIAVPLENPSSDHTQFFNSRIVGGTVVPDGFAPHMVALIFGSILKSFLCGASIITKIHIMTAAHCITSIADWHGHLLRSAHGLVGTNTWNDGGVVVEFKSYQNHPEYDQARIKYDIGVLTVETPIEFNRRVQPIGLECGWVGGGVPCYVTGWGTEQGDSGSALVEIETEKQVALISWGFPCAIGAPDMHTRVGSACDFIHNATDNMTGKH